MLKEEELLFVQVLNSQELHGEKIEDRANDPVEEDNDANNTFEEDGTNRFIQDTFKNVRINDDGNQFDVAYNIHVLQRESEPLYEG